MHALSPRLAGLAALAALLAPRPTAAAPLAVGQRGTTEAAVERVTYLAAAPRAEVDAFGIFVARATTDSHDHSGVSLLLLQGNGEVGLGNFMGKASVRFLVTEFLPDLDASLFFQELFAGWRLEELMQVKAGKFYQHFGRDWDYSFSGPLLFNNDLKMRPDVGVAIEGSPSVTRNVDINYALQFFFADGQGFGSLSGEAWGKDIRHKNTLVANVAPGITFAPGIEARLGASAKVGTSCLTADGQGAQGLVTTLGVDLDARVREVAGYLEVGRQFDDSTNLTSADINFDTNLRVPAFTYVWAGTKYTYQSLMFRLGYYDQFFADRARETQLVPGMTYTFNERVKVMAEFNLWLTNNQGAAANVHDSRFRDRSFYLALMANI